MQTNQLQTSEYSQGFEMKRKRGLKFNKKIGKKNSKIKAKVKYHKGNSSKNKNCKYSPDYN